MNLKGKIKRRGSCRKVHYISLRSKDEYLIVKEVHLQGLKEFCRIISFLLPFKRLSEPGQLLLIVICTGLSGLSFFVFPVSCNTVFSDAVHLIGSDLYLKRISLIINNSGVKGLIQIWLWHCYIVFEPSWNRYPPGVNCAQNCIAVFN